MRMDWTWDATSVAIAPNDTLFATGSHDGLVIIRSLITGAVVRTLAPQPDAVWSLAFSPDGTLLALGSDDNPNSPDGTIELWDTEAWSYRGTYAREDTGGTWSLAFAHDSHHLTIGHTDGAARLWRVRDATIVKTFPHECEIPRVAMAGSSPILAHGCDTTVRVYDLQTDTLMHQFEGHHAWIHGMAFAPSDPYLAVSSTQGPVSLWHLAHGRLVKQLLEDVEVRCLTFSPNGQMLVCGCDDGQLRIVRLADDQLVQTLPAHTGWIRSLAYALNGTVLVSSGTDGKVCIWQGT
jgi:WD40 repeat protein